MLNKLICMSQIIFPSKKKKQPFMDYDHLVGMSMNINREIKEMARKGMVLEKILFYDNSETCGGIQYELIYKSFE